MNEFQPGDVVQLRSGSAPMTVRAVDERGPFPLVHCEWMVEDTKEIQRHTFSAISLVLRVPIERAKARERVR